MKLAQFQWSEDGGQPILDWEMRQGRRWKVALELMKGVLMGLGWRRYNHIYWLKGKRQRKVLTIQGWKGGDVHEKDAGGEWEPVLREAILLDKGWLPHFL